LISTHEAQPHSHIDPISHTLPTPPQFIPSTPITTNVEPTIPQPNGSPSPFLNPSTPPTIDTPNPNIIDQHIQEPPSNHALPYRSRCDTHPPSYLSDYHFQIPSLNLLNPHQHAHIQFRVSSHTLMSLLLIAISL